MKLKYYLRGIGIGVFVTAIILHFSLAGKGNTQLSDEEIKQKAAALGMIESTVLKPVSDNSVTDNDVSNNSAINNSDIDKEETNTDLSEKESVSNDTAIDGELQSDAGIEENIADDKNTDKDANTDAGIEANTKDDDTSKDDLAETETKPEQKPEVTETNNSEDKTNAEAKTEAGSLADNFIININAGDSSFVVAKRCADAGLVESAAEYDMYLCKNGYDKRLVVGAHNIKAGASEEEIAKNLTSVAK